MGNAYYYEDLLGAGAVILVLVPLAYGICLIRCARAAHRPMAEELPALPEEGGFVPHDPFAGLDDNETN